MFAELISGNQSQINMNHFDRTYFVDVRAYLLVIYALAEPHMIDKIDKYTKAVASYAARG